MPLDISNFAAEAEHDGLGQSNAVSSIGEDSSLWVYGHSFTQQPGAFCTSGNEFHNRIKTRRGFSAVTTYGVGNSRSVDVSQDVIAQATHTPMAGSTWDGTRKGAIIVDCLFNDVYNANAGTGNTDPLSATQQANLTATIQTILAVLTSSGRVECETAGTKGGSWLADSAAANYSNGTTTRTGTDGATMTVPVTVPAAGYVWFLTYGVSTAQAGAFTITEGGTTYATRTQASMQVASVFSKRATAAAQTVLPFVIKVTATPGAHTFVVTKTGNDGGFLFADAFLLPSSNPLPIAFLRDPLPQANSTGNISGNSTNLPTVTANMPLVNACATSALASLAIPTIYDIDPKMPANGQSFTDFLHPNDRGMRQIADAVMASGWLLSDLDSLYTTV